ncbi:MAG TPA: serine/threonine-protein kinase [Planctomycetota bacterium]|nr:serine/threonine-protein kinase [Planctomycetota bacterium]
MGTKPESLGKYKILRELGRGGMAVVFEAVDADLGRRVAVKLYHPRPEASPEQARVDEERFLREARLSAALPKHPNVVGVHDAAIDGERRYIVMELVDGRPFNDWIKEEKPPLPRQIEVLRDVALAVHHAHEHGIVHRDLKPANILVTADGRPHVTDFGLAKVDVAGAVSLTADGFAVGTPGYMSPEQAQGLKTLDRRTDVYSLGVMLYELIAGRAPYQGDSAIAILTQVIRDPIKPPSTILKGRPLTSIDLDLEKICLKGVAKKAAERYPTSKAFADDLDKWLQGKKVVVDLPREARKRSPWMWAVPAALLPLAAALVFSLAGRTPAPAPPPAPPPPPAPRVVEVPARTLWTDSGFDVRAGEAIVADCQGKWTNHDGKQPYVSAAGRERLLGTRYEHYTRTWPVPGGFLMALVGRVGEKGDPFVIPPELPIRVPATGRLWLGPNDSPPATDNGGALVVTLRKVPASPTDARAAVAVPATAPWTDTGLEVQPGDALEIIPSGTWPKGVVLRARVGDGAPWAVDYAHQAPAPGPLRLGPSETGPHPDLKVTVVLRRRP